MDYILVGVGGIFGSILRYSLGKYINKNIDKEFPFGTFIINISGAFLLGFVSAVGSNKNLYSLFGDGFCGAYTTFSTFMFEGVTLIKNNKNLNAMCYVILSLALGIIGYYLGNCVGSVI